MNAKIFNEVKRLQSLMGVSQKNIMEVSNPRAAIVTSIFDELIQKGETTAVKEILQKFGKNVSDELITAIRNKGIYSAISEAETDGMYNLIKQLTQSSSAYKSIFSSEIAKSVQKHISEIMDETFQSIDSHMAKATPEQLDGYYNQLMDAIEKEYPGSSQQFNQVYYGKTGRFLGQQMKNGIISAKKLSEKANFPEWVQRKWFVNDTNSNILDLFRKADKLMNIPFDASQIKIINKGDFQAYYKGQKLNWDFAELKLPTGDEIILYKSTGTGAPDLKQAGDWQVINGWYEREDGSVWFVKDEKTTQLTKGQNPYLTELDKYVKSNGIDSLGKESMSSSTSKSTEPFKNQSGQFVSSESFDDSMIDWSKVTNAKNMREYNKLIIDALNTGNYSNISRFGFEKYGIPNFREFLQTKMDLNKKVGANPDNGLWYFTIK